MPNADLHGSTIDIDTGDGQKRTFELVRVGTIQEFDTTKSALEGSRRAVGLSVKENDSLRSQVKDALAKAEKSSEAYVVEKGVSAQLRGELVAADSSYRAAESCNENLAAAIEAAESENAKQREMIGKQGNELADAQEANRSLRAELDNAKDEKASLEESDAELRSELASVRALVDVATNERDTRRLSGAEMVGKIRHALEEFADEQKTLLDVALASITGE